MIFDSARTPILITCRDRLEPLARLVSWLEAAGHDRIVLVDNDSTYPPLVRYFGESPHQVLRLGRNLGHLAVWEADVLGTLGHTGPFVVTDCDVVPDEDAPYDAVDRFAELLFRYSDVDKVGFGLRIDDLPGTYEFRDEVIIWESQFWEVEVEPGVFRADIDTTFALYRPSATKGTYRALRTGPPYVARHVPWYSTSDELSEEERFYRDRAKPGISNWDTTQIPEHLRDAIDARRFLLATRLLADGEPSLAPWAAIDTQEATRPENRDFQFYEFVAALVSLTPVSMVLQLGIGDGELTRRIGRALEARQRIVCVEPDEDSRTALGRIPFFAKPGRELSPHGSPSDSDLNAADLTIARCEPSINPTDLVRQWTSLSREGTALVVYGQTEHYWDVESCFARASELGLSGTPFGTPPRGFICFKGRDDPLQVRASLENQLEAERRARQVAEAEVEAIRRSRSYRFIEPVRRLRRSSLVSALLNALDRHDSSSA